MSDELAVLGSLIARFSEVDPAQVTATTRFDALPRWGSLPALQLLAALEKEFPVSFAVRDYLTIETVGALAQAIREQTAGEAAEDEDRAVLALEG